MEGVIHKTFTTALHISEGVKCVENHFVSLFNTPLAYACIALLGPLFKYMARAIHTQRGSAETLLQLSLVTTKSWASKAFFNWGKKKESLGAKSRVSLDVKKILRTGAKFKSGFWSAKTYLKMASMILNRMNVLLLDFLEVGLLQVTMP